MTKTVSGDGVFVASTVFWGRTRYLSHPFPFAGVRVLPERGKQQTADMNQHIPSERPPESIEALANAGNRHRRPHAMVNILRIEETAGTTEHSMRTLLVPDAVVTGRLHEMLHHAHGRNLDEIDATVHDPTDPLSPPQPMKEYLLGLLSESGAWGRAYEIGSDGPLPGPPALSCIYKLAFIRLRHRAPREEGVEAERRND